MAKKAGSPGMKVNIRKIGSLRSMERWAIFPADGGEPLWMGMRIAGGGTKRDAVAEADLQGWEVTR